MTFNEYLEYYEKHKKRMCKALQNDCSKCPLSSLFGCHINLNALLSNYTEVEEWAEKNPEVTYRQNFKNKFLNTEATFFENACRCEIYGRPTETDEEGCPPEMESCRECWNTAME